MDALTNSRPNLTVLLIEDRPNQHSELKSYLIHLNYTIRLHIDTQQAISSTCTDISADIIIINTHTPSNHILKELSNIDKLAPLPVLVFAQQDAREMIQSTLKAGVSAYIVGNIQMSRLTCLIDVAIERFNQRQLLIAELKKTKTQLADRKIVERAKGYIMQEKQITEQQAFKLLRNMAMNNGQSLAAISKNIIEVYNMLEHNMK
ncbi:ANTAR domain-containing response regulator [Psychromonas sp. 14N.309.X.WAT.B.A12]|uniref:ANTAR domain-containing response regulator n=1 Tax=unclassified Psychromonas TaxID=2614957 RepID=UPI0025B0A87C|nr:ANTAR domain-containing protein [Psychromonas sp. 14N.309.X.WAT.B.A12]MDN2662247.1 ANTAR domain-containing protein [Psychromonas sp. 14N.309.X.WAT.B.A12]